MSAPEGMPTTIFKAARALGRAGGWLLGRARLTVRWSMCLARRLRYVPLALAAIGALMVTFGPKPRLVAKKPRTLTVMPMSNGRNCCRPVRGSHMISARGRSRHRRLRPTR
jgi:hypothetical protein